jgi:glutamine cyclotransferase
MLANHSNKMLLLLLAVILTPRCLCAAPDTNEPSSPADPNAAPVYTYRIINTFPHDPAAFTQGLVFADGFLYESTGRYGQSELRKTTLETAQVLKRYRLRDTYFAEGITFHRNRIIQLTWKSRIGFVYDSNTLQLLRTFEYPTEGWGITSDPNRLIMSDGTSNLYLLDPNTFEPIGKLKVHDNNTPLIGLNELELVNGRIYANIWQQDRIAVISPEKGKLLAWIDLKGILNPKQYKHPIDVLNGIAYDTKNDRLFITGKLWPLIFEIKLLSTK